MAYTFLLLASAAAGLAFAVLYECMRYDRYTDPTPLGIMLDALLRPRPIDWQTVDAIAAYEAEQRYLSARRHLQW